MEKETILKEIEYLNSSLSINKEGRALIEQDLDKNQKERMRLEAELAQYEFQLRQQLLD